MLGSTNLSSLDISNNNLLQVLSISGLSSITSLDVSQKTNLQELYAQGTGLNSLDVSNNSQLTRCYTQNNSGNLTCVQVNQTQLSNIPIGFTKDSSTSYSLDCISFGLLNAKFNNPSELNFDSNGNLFISDVSNHRIRKITPQGVVTTYSGSTQGYQN